MTIDNRASFISVGVNTLRDPMRSQRCSRAEGAVHGAYEWGKSAKGSDTVTVLPVFPVLVVAKVDVWMDGCAESAHKDQLN